ncbi:SET domain-containing protein-lysine N-methyltransferase [Candidatus Woesearchaeota archaeon]|nr:SET domain-containing protein-lysine N-methyltransferase [Candidatus Woesearchaeota archaeon]
MLFVKTRVLPSRIHGLGLFADEDIPKDTILWKFTSEFDLKFTKEQIRKFSKQVQEYLETYCWLSKKSGKYCFCSDDARYFNHSQKPNCFSTYLEDEEEVVTTAVKNIRKGEELTDDYRAFEKDFNKDWG